MPDLSTTSAIVALAGSLVGAGLVAVVMQIVDRCPRYIVAFEYQGSVHGEPPVSYVFYLRPDTSLRGDEREARRFLTRRGAKAAAAEFMLSDNLKEHGAFRFIQVRILRVDGL